MRVRTANRSYPPHTELILLSLSALVLAIFQLLVRHRFPIFSQRTDTNTTLSHSGIRFEQAHHEH
jgi:hypothetical protein